MKTLPVRFAEQRVAELSQDRGRLELRYLPGATSPVSVRLPLGPESHPDPACRCYFGNLLPEGGFREQVCRGLGLAPSEDFTLLGLLGSDCAGAVSFYSEGEQGPSARGYRRISERELRGWLEQPASRPSPVDVPGLRFAISGAQDKLVLHLAQGEAYLCQLGAPSTLLLKPDIREDFQRIELSALNELFCMQLARVAGLAVPRSFWFAGAYAVERFDRTLLGERVERLHQEDFAQLLGRPASAKYEVDFRDCFELLEQLAAAPEQARRELFERLVFNLLIGNADAHGKNFALLFTSAGARLAPAYDLLCTQIYPSLSDQYAMRVGAARRQEELTVTAWQQLAEDARLPYAWVVSRGAELCDTVQLALRDIGPSLLNDNPGLAHDIYPQRRLQDFMARLADTLLGNCKRVARSFAARR